MSVPDDQIRVRHMLQAAREAMKFVEEKQRKDLDQDRLLVLGLIKAVEIIGEAASRVSRNIRLNIRKFPGQRLLL